MQTAGRSPTRYTMPALTSLGRPSETLTKRPAASSTSAKLPASPTVSLCVISFCLVVSPRTIQCCGGGRGWQGLALLWLKQGAVVGSEKLCRQMENVSVRVSEGAGMTQALIGIKGWGVQRHSAQAWSKNFASKVRAVRDFDKWSAGKWQPCQFLFFFSYHTIDGKTSPLGLEAGSLQSI